MFLVNESQYFQHSLWSKLPNGVPKLIILEYILYFNFKANSVIILLPLIWLMFEYHVDYIWAKALTEFLEARNILIKNMFWCCCQYLYKKTVLQNHLYKFPWVANFWYYKKSLKRTSISITILICHTTLYIPFSMASYACFVQKGNWTYTFCYEVTYKCTKPWKESNTKRKI